MTEELACVSCILERSIDDRPIDLASVPRFATLEALLDHKNAVHLPDPQRWRWNGTEPIWRSGAGIRKARAADAGVIICSGDADQSFLVLWCLHCDVDTSDPEAVKLRRCLKCGRDYSHLEV